MTTTSSSLGQFTQSSSPFYDNTFVDVSNTFARALSNTNRFNITLCNAFADSFSIYFNTISEYNKSWKDLSGLVKILRNRFRKAFDEKFREENSLMLSISSYSELASVTGLGDIYLGGIYLTRCRHGIMIS